MSRLNALFLMVLSLWLTLLALLKTPLRMLAYRFLKAFGLITEHPYSEAAATTSGYFSSLSTRRGHCLAFRRADDTLQFYW